MASEVGICNSALSKIGVTQAITSLTEGTKNANACNEQYEKLRDDALRGHVWNFAVQRVKLAQSSTVPAFGYDHQYPLPADWLRTVSVHDNNAGTGALDYRLETEGGDGRVIVTSADEVYLRYVSRVTDPNRMTADFREALALKLAAELAIPIAQSGTLHDRMEASFERKMRRARGTDAIEDSPEEFPAASWVADRG